MAGHKSDRETVVMSNQLVEASYRLTTGEQRLVHTAIAEIEHDQRSVDAYIVISAERFSEVTGVPVNDAYSEMQDAVDRLWGRELTLHDAPAGHPLTDNVYPIRVRWIASRSAAVYQRREGKCGIRFSPDVAPYLTDFRYGQFTKYPVEYIGPMRSQYGPRLYELLCQWKNTKNTLTFSLEWLRRTWEIEEMRIDNVKRYVIKPAMEAVNDHTDLSVNADYQKTGKRITHVTFYFKSNKSAKPAKPAPASNPKPSKPKSSDRNAYENHQEPKITQEEIEQQRASFGFSIVDIDDDTKIEHPKLETSVEPQAAANQQPAVKREESYDDFLKRTREDQLRAYSK